MSSHAQQEGGCGGSPHEEEPRKQEACPAAARQCFLMQLRRGVRIMLLFCLKYKIDEM